MILKTNFNFCPACGKRISDQVVLCNGCEAYKDDHIPDGRYYLSGPMTGLPDLNFPAFHAAAARMRDNGLWVLNPAEFGEVDGATWQDYYRRDITLMLREQCTAIVMLPGWPLSTGIRIEFDVAHKCGMSCFTYEVAGLFPLQSTSELPIEFSPESR